METRRARFRVWLKSGIPRTAPRSTPTGKRVCRPCLPGRRFDFYVINPEDNKKTKVISYRYEKYTEKIPGVVTDVQIGMNNSGYNYAKVMVAWKMELINGDKVASYHGQKGVCGLIAPQEDLPFTNKGIYPDILINPLALPSRMTMGQLAESILGKAICLRSGKKKVTDLFKGDHGDLTPFHKNFDLTEIGKELSANGYRVSGDEIVMDGYTGKRMNCLVFSGLVFYQRLKHMIMDKKHECTRAPKLALSHQPLEGRTVNGGLRIGIMERDQIASCGAAYFLKDRLFDQSDQYKMWVCDDCGLPALVHAQGTLKECTVCEHDKVSLVALPYGSKLLMQELFAMNIATRIVVTDRGAEIKILEHGNLSKDKPKNKK